MTNDWPSLPLAEWEPTYITLHLWTQIVGKVRLAQSKWMNHWWHIALYVNSHGLTTSSIPCSDGRQLTLTFDFCSHRLVAHASDKRADSFALEPMSVADFYERTMALLARLDVKPHIWPVPVEMAEKTPFPKDREHVSYDRGQVERLHRILISTERVFSSHRGRFVGKSSPVHFFWGAFDLAVTRFSGKPNPKPPPDPVNGEAYSHEVISHGFWPGGDWPLGGRVDEPVFYSYALPEPAGFKTARVLPADAKYSDKFGEFFLPYDAVRKSEDPEARLIEFMESTYLAAARAGGWEIEALEHPRWRSRAKVG